MLCKRQGFSIGIPPIVDPGSRRYKKHDIADDSHRATEQHDWTSTDPARDVGTKKHRDKACHVRRDSEELCRHVTVAQGFDNRWEK